MVRKTAKGPLSRVEVLVLQALVKRHVKSAGGTHILKVPAHARHHTYIRTAMAKKTANKVSSRQVYRRMDAVQEFSNLHGASPEGTAPIQKKLSGRWADAESYQVNVPQLGTLELCCDMRASNCQLQVMRSHLTSWGLPVLCGWRIVLKQKKELWYNVSVEPLHLQVSLDKKENVSVFATVPVLRVESMRHRLTRKVELLLSRDKLPWPAWLPKDTLVIVLNLDAGKGTMKLTLRLLNVANHRSRVHVDCIVWFSAMETYKNIVQTCRQHLKEVQSLHLQQLLFGGHFRKVMFIHASNFKMQSITSGHAGQSCTFFSPFCLGSDLSAGIISGGPILSKYLHLARSQVSAGSHDGEVVATHYVDIRRLEEVEACAKECDALEVAQLQKAKVPKKPIGSAQTMSITHPPIFWLGVDYCLPAPLHCNLGIVTNGMDALESLLVKFDRQLCTEGPIPEALEERRQRWNNAALQVARCKQEVELKLREVQELQNRIDEAKRKIDDLNVDSDQSSGDEGDADDVGLAWLERRRRQNQRSRRQRSERRAVRSSLQVGELEEAMSRARCAFLEAEGELKFATQLPDTSYEALESASDIHMVRLKTVCKQFRVNKGAYLGHGYTGDICKKICTMETSMLACFRQLHVSNNVKALLGTGPQDP